MVIYVHADFYISVYMVIYKSFFARSLSRKIKLVENIDFSKYINTHFLKIKTEIKTIVFSPE